MNILPQYLTDLAQRAWFCIKLAFGHWERKAFPLEKINSASQISLSFKYVLRLEVGSLPLVILLPAFGTEAS